MRGPETGLVMLRGRIGGGGAPFNFGEATVTRATVRLPGGAIGHAYALGRDKREGAACGDRRRAVAGPRRRDVVEARSLGAAARGQRAADARRRAETAATKVDFFTMVRGED